MRVKFQWHGLAQRLLLALLFLTLAGLVCSTPLLAQSWPSKPVRLLIPNGAGAPPDIVARALSQPLTQAFGQAFVVENRVGANGIIAMEALAKAAPDGHVLCFTQGAPISLNPYFYSKLPYDPPRDFSPVVNVGVIAASIVGAADQPANNLRELIEQARSKPDSVVWATWGSGSFSDLYRAWAENSFGVRFREVPYKTSEQAFNAVLRGEAQVLLNASGMLAPHVKAGKVKALGTIGARRFAGLPDAPSFSELGYDLDFRGWVGLFAPANTPREVVTRLNAEINRQIAQPGFVERFMAAASIEPRGGSPEDFAAFLKVDRELAGRLVRLAGVKPQ